MDRKAYTELYKKDVKRFIDVVIAKTDINSQAQMARLIDQTSQNFNNKLVKGTLNATELWQIADALDCEVCFVDKKTGKVIS